VTLVGKRAADLSTLPILSAFLGAGMLTIVAEMRTVEEKEEESGV
jgi:hypothetical protein